MEQSTEQNSDTELIRTVLAGSKEEFRHLVRKYQNQVYAMIGRQINNNAIAEDLAQETFLKAYRGLKSFNHRSTFSTWLTRIALNTTASYFSSAQYKKQRHSESLDETKHNNLASADYKHHELLTQLKSALAVLCPQHREVFVLCGLEGRSYEEVATMLGVPVGTVRSRLNKARLELVNVMDF